LPKQRHSFTTPDGRSLTQRSKTAAEMHPAALRLAGWDFGGETANGMQDIWWILEGKDYPRLWWETATAETRNSNLKARNKFE